MSLIKIELGDWLKNAAVIGLINVLNHKETIENKVKYNSNSIEFDSVMLEGFEEEYFKVLIEKNEKSISWFRLVEREDKVQDYLENLNMISQDDLKLINDIIDDFKKKLTSNSYKNAYLILEDSSIIENICKKLTNIKMGKNQKVVGVLYEVKEQLEYINSAINYLKQPEVKKIIAAKNVMYDIVQPFWTNVSFLLKTNNKEDMYELYKNDFIDTAVEYYEKDKTKYKYTCFTCDNKISKFRKPEAYDLTWLVKTGVDMSRKSSHFWNMNGDAYICPICNLVYSCLPLGFIVLNGKGIFINNNQSVKSLIQSNNLRVSYEKDTFEQIEQMSYFNILNSMENYSVENLDKEIENIQVVKIDVNNSSRPYSFNVLSKKLMKIMYMNKKRLEKLIKIRVDVTDKYKLNLYEEVIRRLYDSKKLYDLIFQLLTLNFQGKFKAVNRIYDILIINNSMGGINMRYDDSNRYKNYGQNLRNIYIKKDGDAKLSGITYRLLNALKTKDSAKFMDTLINSYMYMKSEIPTDFIKALNNQDMLQSVGYAFLIGLQGQKDNVDNKEENDNDK